MTDPTYSSETYASDTYDTGEQSQVKHSVPFSVFEWSQQEVQKPEEIFERPISILQSLPAVQRREIKTESRISQLRHGFVKIIFEIITEFDMREMARLAKIARFYSAVQELQKTHNVKIEGLKFTFTDGEKNDKQD